MSIGRLVDDGVNAGIVLLGRALVGLGKWRTSRRPAFQVPVSERALLDLEERVEVFEPALDPEIRVFGPGSLLEWMQENRRTDVVVQCGYCMKPFDGLSAYTVHMMTCDLKPDARVPAAGVAAGIGSGAGERTTDNRPAPEQPEENPRAFGYCAACLQPAHLTGRSRWRHDDGTSICGYEPPNP